MPKTLTGGFNRHGVYTAGTGNYASSGGMYVGYEATSDGGRMHRLYLAPGGGEAFLYADTADDTCTLRLTIELAKKTVTSSSQMLLVWLYTVPLDTGSAEALYEGMYSRYYTSTAQVIDNTTTKQEITLTGFNGTEIRNLLKGGLGLAADSTADLLQINSVTLELDVLSAETAPTITLDTDTMSAYGYFRDDGSYILKPDKVLMPVVLYSQEAGSTLSTLTVRITDRDGNTTTVERSKVYGIVLDDDVWRDIPQSGTIAVYAVSAAGVSSNTLVIPFEVAYRNVNITSHTSGTIVQSDTDVVLTWETVLPSAFTSCNPPTQYAVWVWWDNEERSAAATVTELTYTIPSASLTGRRVLHVEIDDQYGTDGTKARRRVGEGTTLNLYVQQVAGVGSVEVGPIAENGLCMNPPYVKWTATGQTAAQVRFGDHVSPILWGDVSAYVVPAFYPENSVQGAQVRLQDENGIWGDWTEILYVTMERYKDTGTTLTLKKEAAGVRVQIQVMTGLATYCLFRDGVLLKQFTGFSVKDVLEYMDTAANGECRYYVYGIYYGGSVEMPSAKTIDATPKTDGIVTGSGEWIPLEWSSDFPRAYPSNTAEETHAKYYAGRAYPVYMSSGRRSKQLTREYVDLDGGLADRLEALAGQCVWFRDTMGNRIYGEINNVSAGRGKKYTTVSFVISRADVTEGVELVWEGYNGVYID